MEVPNLPFYCLSLNSANKSNRQPDMLDYQSAADLLKCGSCSTEFLLSDIVFFIQHKTKPCKLSKSYGDNKENCLKCSTCSESFNTADSLLEHAQFIHKIDIFIENSPPLNNKSDNKAESKSKSSKTNQVHDAPTATSSPSSNNMKSGSVPSSDKDHIFIDLIPSDSNIRFMDRNQSFNITVSSTSDSSSSSSPNFLKNFSTNSSSHKQSEPTNNQNVKEQTETRQQSDENLEKNSDKEKCFVDDHCESTSSSCDSNQIGSKSETSPFSQCNKTNDESPERRKKSKSQAAFYCEVCQAAFNQKIHLTKHSAKHTGIKPFKCSECNYSTVERSHLKVHVRVHTGEKPFKCTFCEYATAQSSTLKIHKKRHHDKIDMSEQNSVSNSASNLDLLNKEDSTSLNTKFNDDEKKIDLQTPVKDLSTQVYCDLERRNFNFRNLPPNKRFKNLNEFEAQQNMSMSMSKPQCLENEEASSSKVLKDAENKLLGLANIALEREETN